MTHLSRVSFTSYHPLCIPCSNKSLKPGEKSQQKTNYLISDSMLLCPNTKRCCRVFARLGSRRWWVALPIYTIILSKLWWHLYPFLSYLHCLITARQPMFHCNQSSPSLSSICCQTLSLFSRYQDGHWIQTITMHMSIFKTNYIHSSSSFCHLLDFVTCSPNQLLTNHMLLETKYFSKVLLNREYF